MVDQFFRFQSYLHLDLWNLFLPFHADLLLSPCTVYLYTTIETWIKANHGDQQLLFWKSAGFSPPVAMPSSSRLSKGVPTLLRHTLLSQPSTWSAVPSHPTRTGSFTTSSADGTTRRSAVAMR